MIRYFDQFSFDSIYYYLGVGGQPISKSINPIHGGVQDNDIINNKGQD